MTQDENVASHDQPARQGEQDLENPQMLTSEMAKAFQELARGERTASVLESRLDGIENRINELLASVEQNARDNHGSSSGNMGNQSQKTSSPKPK